MYPLTRSRITKEYWHWKAWLSLNSTLTHTPRQRYWASSLAHCSREDATPANIKLHGSQYPSIAHLTTTESEISYSRSWTPTKVAGPSGPDEVRPVVTSLMCQSLDISLLPENLERWQPGGRQSSRMFPAMTHKSTDQYHWHLLSVNWWRMSFAPSSVDISTNITVDRSLPNQMTAPSPLWQVRVSRHWCYF